MQQQQATNKQQKNNASSQITSKQNAIFSSEKQIENLKSKIIQFSSNCAKEGEKYGYRYICK